ncbi:Uncharacterised protein [Vibrio cholerae]|nr:Uncharacterised protein [Vibrio cholerae]
MPTFLITKRSFLIALEVDSNSMQLSAITVTSSSEWK